MRSIPAAILLALVTSSAYADGLTLDCSKATGEVQKAVCDSDTLRSLNDEMTKLYTLAFNGSQMTQQQASKLKSSQKNWLAERDKCTESTLDMKVCIANADAMQIQELRTSYPAARASDDGVSIGPIAYRCEGIEAPLNAVFINTMEHLVSLRWSDRRIVLPQVISGSGARYQTDYPGVGEATFWDHGNESLFAPPGEDTVNCTKEPPD